jgi:hypothetical protein
MSYAVFTDDNGNQSIVQHGEDIQITLIDGQAPSPITDQEANDLIAQQDQQNVQSE